MELINQHCVKNVQIRRFSGSYLDWIRENMDQKKLRIWTFFAQTRRVNNVLQIAYVARIPQCDTHNPFLLDSFVVFDPSFRSTLPAKCLSLTYDLNCFEYRVNGLFHQLNYMNVFIFYSFLKLHSLQSLFSLVWRKSPK